MSVGNAIKLLKTVGHDSDLREEMYKCSNSKALIVLLETKGLQCNAHELEEAINSQHVLCQELEEAQDLMHKAELLRFLFNDKIMKL